MKVGLCVALIVFASVAPVRMALGDSPAVKSGDGQPDGKKSLGGSGEMIEFVMPDEQSEVSGIRIHGARYGLPQAPNESFLIYFLSADESEVVRTELAPYALFDRGPEKWVEVKFSKPVKVPQKFWVAIDFRPGRTKGVYVSYDSSSDGKRSRIGLPGMESKPCDFAGDWMIEILPAK
jgi:hypothetical protein